MIQFKKIPPGKSVLLLLLFLTTNISGFLQEYQQENEISRKTQNRFSMDLQQPSTRNMPIRKTGIDRVINEKDGNSERLYDRRSFRTGTIQTSENMNAERSLERSRAVIRDINNNRQRFTRNTQDELRHTRDNRRSRDDNISRVNRQSIAGNVRDRRLDERSQIFSNRRYDERSLNMRTKRDLNRRVDESFEMRDRINSEIRDRRINDRRINTDSRNIKSRRDIRENTANERREIEDQQTQIRSTTTREQSERQSTNRFTQERRSTRFNIKNRASSELTGRALEIRRSVRSVDIRSRRTSDERDIPQRQRQSTERLERVNSRENTLESRTIQNQDRRTSSTERNSRENVLKTRNIENRDRLSLDRDVDQRRLSSKTRNQILSAAERRERHSGENLSKRQSIESRRRLPENADQRQMASRERNTDRTSASTERLQRNSRDISMQQRTIDNTDRRLSDRLQSPQRNNHSDERMDRRNVMESRNSRARRIFENRNSDRSRYVDNRTVRDRSDRDMQQRQSRRSLDEREIQRVRTTRQNSERDVTRQSRDSPSRQNQARQFTINRSQSRRLSDRSTDRLQRIDSRDTRRSLSERRETYTDRVDSNRRTTVDDRRISRETPNTNNRELSRSDSTRYIQDNTNFRDARLAHREYSTIPFRANLMKNKNSLRENYFTTNRYTPITADFRKHSEKADSQSKSTKDAEIPVLNFENNAWANTAKIILVAFLVAQIFVNSSKTNKFRFHNIMSMATSVKEKVQ